MTDRTPFIGTLQEAQPVTLPFDKNEPIWLCAECQAAFSALFRRIHPYLVREPEMIGRHGMWMCRDIGDLQGEGDEDEDA